MLEETAYVVIFCHLIAVTTQSALFEINNSTGLDPFSIPMCSNGISCEIVALTNAVLEKSLTVQNCTGPLYRDENFEKQLKQSGTQLKVMGEVIFKAFQPERVFLLESCFKTGITGCHIWKEVVADEDGNITTTAEGKSVRDKKESNTPDEEPDDGDKSGEGDGKDAGEPGLDRSIPTTNELFQKGVDDNTTIVTFTMKYYYTTTFARNCDDIELYFEQQTAIQNQHFINSKLPIRMKMFCFEGLDLSDGLQEGKMLDYFEDEVRPSWASLRGSADAAALFVQSFGYCGLAWVKSWGNGRFFSVNAGACSQKVMPHEIGHNIGAHHKHGFKNNATGKRTTLNGNDIAYYSSPNLMYPDKNGTPLGDKDHNVAKMWKEARFALAALGDESWGCKDVEVIRGFPKKLTVTTKNGESWCGTDSSVYVSIIGPNGESCKTGALETSANDFQKGATDVFTSLGRQCVVTSFPEGVSKLIVELSGNDAWCFQDAVLELDSGEKFKFENPEKHRKGKPDQSDWIRNEKRASTAVKIGSATRSVKESPLVKKIEIKSISGCDMMFKDKFQVGITGLNGEFCETPMIDDTNKAKAIVGDNLGDCGKLRLSDGMKRMMLKGDAGGDNFCFGGSVVTLSDGVQNGCLADKSAKLTNGQLICETVKLEAASVAKVRISTSGLDSACSMEENVGPFSISMTFPLKDKCSSPEFKNLDVFPDETFSTIEGNDLGDCSKNKFSEGLTSIEVKRIGQGPWCLKNMEVDLDDGKTFGCPGLDKTKAVMNSKSCKPVELTAAIKSLKIMTSNRQSCSTKSLAGLTVSMAFTKGDSCSAPLPSSNFKRGLTTAFVAMNLQVCGKRKFSSGLTGFSLELDDADDGESWCFNSMELEMKNGDLYGCVSSNPMKPINKGDKISCNPVLLEKGSDKGRCTKKKTDWSCCSKSSKCMENGGDCDNDHDCHFGMTCGKDNCKPANPLADGQADCCVKATSTECVDGWSQLESSCYKFVNEGKNWEDASKACLAYKTNLVSIQTQAEDQLASKLANGKAFWTGGLRESGGSRPWTGMWKWSDGSEFNYTNWHPSEPNSARQQRIQGNYGSKWDDNQASAIRPFVCEYNWRNEKANAEHVP